MAFIDLLTGAENYFHNRKSSAMYRIKFKSHSMTLIKIYQNSDLKLMEFLSQQSK